MVLYLIFIFGCMAVCFAANGIYGYLSGAFPVWVVLVLVLLNFVVQLFIDIIFALIVRHVVPKKTFSPYNRIFRVYHWENKFYQRIKINSWKEYIPELGGKLADFDKRSIRDFEPKYLFKFLQETCYAEAMHFVMIFTSVINLFLYPARFFFNITLPLSLVNFVVHFPPIFIQRFNRPRLLRIYELKLRSEAKKAEQAQQAESNLEQDLDQDEPNPLLSV